MSEIVLVTGGARSGKSRLALDMAEKVEAGTRIFIATCVPMDREMRDRVARHRAERGSDWTTLEVPVLLPEAIKQHAGPGTVVLVDCLTLWINNLLANGETERKIAGRTQQLVRALDQAEGDVILVSNEVGCGIVPENLLARLFRDLAGFANQAVAAQADRVVWMVSGLPVTVKDPRGD